MDGEVFQNSDEMKALADEINNDSEDLKKEIEEMYELLNNDLGDSDNGNKAWFGPKASQFLSNIVAKQNDFDAQCNNVKKVSANLREQAQAWENFEQ